MYYIYFLLYSVNIVAVKIPLFSAARNGRVKTKLAPNMATRRRFLITYTVNYTLDVQV